MFVTTLTLGFDMDKVTLWRLADIRDDLQLLSGNSDLKYYQFTITKMIKTLDEVIDKETINEKSKN